MNKMYMIFIVLLLLTGCVRQDKPKINDSLSESIFMVGERSFITDSTVINNEIVSFHNPLEFFHHPSFIERNFAPTVLKSFNLENTTSVIVDNDVSSLCNKGDIEKCSSFREYLSNGIIRNDNKLFFTTDLILDKFSSQTVIVMTDLDGSNMEVIYSITNQDSNIYGYVVLNDILYYSTDETGLMAFNIETNKHNVVLENDANSSTFYNLAIEEVGGKDVLKFNALKYTDKSGSVHQKAFIMQIDDELEMIREHGNRIEYISDYKDYILVYDGLTSEIRLEFDNGQKIVLEEDFENDRLGQVDLVGNGYLVLNYYSTNNDDIGGKIALYQIEGDKVTKLNDIVHDENLFLNFMYKNMIVFGRIWSDDEYGDMIHPSYVLIDNKGLGKLYHIDENK